MMIDMDSLSVWNIDGVLSTFENSENWDAVLANGTHSDGTMSDYYAWRDSRLPLGPEILGEVWWHYVFNKAKFRINPHGGFIPVESAFGGIGIYKRQSVLKCQYGALASEELKTLVIKNMSTNPKAMHYYRKFLQHYNLPGAPWKFINNSGYDQSVVCEHVIFYAQMISQGYNRIFVNPRMTFTWRRY